MKRILIAGLGLGVATMSVAPVRAQAAPAAALPAMVEHVCPPQVAGPPRGLLQQMLKPGARLPAGYGSGAKDPAFQAYMAMQAEQRARDFANLCRYQPDNAALAGRTRIVFMGDSITEGWIAGDPSLFGPGVVDRGIGGQTSPQMLLRFYQDVVALHPAVVHIMAGTNDLSGATGPTTPTDYENNIRAMVDMAQANGIRVVLASILPVDHFLTRPDLRPADQVRRLNAWLRDFAARRKIVYADYYAALVDEAGGTKPALSNDGIHPNYDGYALMRPVADAAIRAAQGGR